VAAGLLAAFRAGALVWASANEASSKMMVNLVTAFILSPFTEISLNPY
jgi:hypothetical protein